MPKIESFISKIIHTILIKEVKMEIEITKITSRGQVVIPQDIREERGIKEGEKFLVYDTDDSIVLKRIKNLEKIRNIEDFEATFAKIWKIAKQKKITKKDVSKEIEAYRKEKRL